MKKTTYLGARDADVFRVTTDAATAVSMRWSGDVAVRRHRGLHLMGMERNCKKKLC